MSPAKRSRELARSLIVREADASASPLRTEAATVRVYERLRRQLGAPVGVDGFQAIASRALALAKAESSQLGAVQVTANGGLSGLDQVELEAGAEEDGEAGILLIAKLLGLFLTFLGEATTLRLIGDLRLQVDGKVEAAPSEGGEPDMAKDAILMEEGYEDLLVEIDRLRSVSDHLEGLSATHLGMEDGLMSVAANLRSIASVLDVFTLIRSRAGGPQDEFPNLDTNRYMN